MADASKTEKATPKKRQDERKKGHVFLSKDAVSVATLFASVLILRLIFKGSVNSLGSFLRFCLSHAAYQGSGIPPEMMTNMVVSAAKILGPLILATVAAAVAATFAQTRLLVSGELLKPKFERINPLKGFQRLFSLRSVIEALKGLLKIIVLLIFVYTCLRDMINVSESYLYADVNGACIHIFGKIFSMLLKVGMAFVVLAFFDFLYQWWDYERQMRMSKEEVKEEFKQIEGDPKIKGKIKEQQRRMAQSRMMQQVPEADVVIRNPTHFAVALRYHPGEDTAPVVLAMGQDELALRIVRVAEEHSVMVIENVPLARALYAQSELNQPIPAVLYDAVAEVLVYLYKLGRIKMPEHAEQD